MRNPKQAAFTLIELMVTLAIMALVMTALLATLHGTVQAHDEAEVEISSVRDGPRILDMIEHDLRAIHVYNMKGGNVLHGTSERPGGLRGDRIDLLVCRDSIRRVPDATQGDSAEDDVASEVNEIGYRLRTSTNSDDFLELWRREDMFVDDTPFEGGTYEKIHDRIRRFEVTYLDHLGDKSADKVEWDMEEEKRLPGAIRIDLELQASPELVGGFLETKEDAMRIYKYTRVIAFHEDQTTALAVKPYLPTKILGRNDNGGANGPGAKKGGDKNPLLDQSELGGTQHAGEEGPGGGGSLIDSVGDSGTPSFTFTPDGQSGLNIHIGPDGQLSESDEQKIEDFMNDYRHRFTGKGGGFGGPPPFGPGGGPGGGGGAPSGGMGKGH